MKKRILTAILIVLFFVLQSSVMPLCKIAGVVPNLLIIIVVSVAYFEGRLYGVITGFCVGLLVDLFYSDILGFYGLIYMICGYFVGYCMKKVLVFDYKIPLLLIGATSGISNLAIYICLFVMRGRFQFRYYLGHVIVPELVYTMAAALLVYGILYKIYAKLRTAERRRDGYFV